ncbi:MAG: tetratricopeptide repeat protein [Flavisolibacter sp.]
MLGCRYISLLVAGLFYLLSSANAQSASEKASQWKKLQEAINDTAKVLALLDYGAIYCYTNYDSAEYYYRKAKDLSLKIDYFRGYQKTISYQTEIYDLKGLFDSTMIVSKIALDLAVQKKNAVYQAINLSSIGNVHLYKGNNDSAAWYFIKASRLFEEAKDTMRLGQLYSNLGVVFVNLEQYDRSLYYNHLALDIAKNSNDRLSEGYALNNIGSILKKQKKFDSAAYYFELALPISRQFNDPSLEKDIVVNLGFSELTKQHFASAEEYFNTSLNLSRKLKNEYGIVYSYKGIASIRISEKKYNEAGTLLKTAIAMAKANGFQEELQDLYLLQYEAAVGSGKTAEALEAYRNHVNVKDSLANLQVQKNIASLDRQYQAERKEKTILQKDLQIRSQTLELETKNKWIWVLSLLMFLSAAILFLLWKFFRQKRLADAKQQELMQVQFSMQAKEEERNRIAKELHDDLGGTLSGIVLHSHFMIEQVEDKNTGAVKRSIEKVQTAASEMITKLNDIVWLINPKYDTLEKLVQRIEEFAMDMARAKGMEVKIDTMENPAAIALDTHARKNIYLICKEAINNAVKYSNASELYLNIVRTGSDLQLLIEDNGRGFDVALIRQGNGLTNMKQRATDIGASYLLDAVNNKGTRVSINYKIPQ